MNRDADLRFLRRALELAALGRASASPNPCVGSVIVDGAGERILGEGWHRRAGEPHAEVEALRAARAAGYAEDLRGATLYVNLEPCSHHGRTPPCAEAVIEAGIGRVVACLQDPNPAVAGRGYALLRAAGVEVDVGLLAREAVALNLPFLTSNRHQRPAVTLKWAMSLDGRIATVSGESQWISSPEGRQWALDLRREHDAILVGSGTVLADDPRLNRRSAETVAGGEPAVRPILRAVLDRRLRTPASARLLDVEGPLLIYTEVTPGTATFEALAEAGQHARERGGAELHLLSMPAVTPAAVLADLHGRTADGQRRSQTLNGRVADPVRSLLVEGGGEVAAAFVAADLFDRVEVCCAPRLLSGRSAPGPLGGDGIAALATAPRLDSLRTTTRGADVILSSYRQGCLEALLS